MASLVATILLFAAPCLSHKRLRSPTPRDEVSAPRSDGPCGPVSFDDADTTTDWTAGETVEIVIADVIHHSNQPMRLALGVEDDADSFESCIWLNHIPQTETGGAKDLHISLTVPDMTCERCTLQLMAFQTNGLGESNCCAWEAGGGDCGADQYYSCANVRITGGSQNMEDVCRQPNDWFLRDFKCNYFQAEGSDNAWTANSDGSMSLITSGTINGLDPTATEHCSDTTFTTPIDTSCQALLSDGDSGSSGAASNANGADEMASLFEGGDMKGDGVFAVIVVILLAIAIAATVCLTKGNKDAEEGTSPASSDGGEMYGQPTGTGLPPPVPPAYSTNM